MLGEIEMRLDRGEDFFANAVVELQITVPSTS